MGPIHRMQQTRRAKKLDENGTYTDKDEVAQYIYGGMAMCPSI